MTCSDSSTGESGRARTGPGPTDSELPAVCTLPPFPQGLGDSEIRSQHEVLIPTCHISQTAQEGYSPRPAQPTRVDPRPNQMLQSWPCLRDQECSPNKAQPRLSFPSGPHYPSSPRVSCLPGGRGWGEPGKKCLEGRGEKRPRVSPGTKQSQRGLENQGQRKGSGGVTKGVTRLRFPGNKPLPSLGGFGSRQTGA